MESTHKLTIRKISGKYYQVGYYEKCRWVNILHIGTAQEVVRKLNLLKEITDKATEHTKN